jgi:two-component system chemotaxis response regulator CheB
MTAVDAILPRRSYTPRGGPSEPIVAVGVSTGGVQTMPTLLRGLPADAPGMVVVQHMPAEFIDTYASRFNNDPQILVEVAVAKHQEPLRAGRVQVIPGEVHGLIRRTGLGSASSWSRARRSTDSARAWTSCSARPHRPPAPTPRA